MAKFQKKIEAIELRKKGLSIKEIARILEVSSSSTSLWTRQVVLTNEQYQLLEQHARDPHYGNRLKYIQKIKETTNEKIKNLRTLGIEEVGVLSKRELFLVGISLYWSEGFKKDSQVGFANSDPSMTKLFMRWLFECFEYKIEDLIPRVTINIGHKERIKEVEKYWSDQVGIPIENFMKPFFQNSVWKKTYENPNEYFGLLRIKVRKSKDFLRKIHGYIEGLRLQA